MRSDRTPRPCHGTRAAYVADRCRCEDCTRANRQYERKRSRAQLYGRWDHYVDAGPARDRVRELMAQGMGLKRIVAVSGVSQGSLWKLVYGTRGRDGLQHPSKRVTRQTHERILACPLDLADGATVDGTGTARRLQALVACGWSGSKIAARLGIHRGNLTSLLHGRGDVRAATRDAVKALYDALWDVAPPCEDRGDRIACSRAKHMGSRHGWVPPLAWDDDNIDDPDATPCAGPDDEQPDPIAIQRAMAGDPPAKLRRIERLAAVQTLIDSGLSLAQIAARLRVTPRTVTRDRVDIRHLPDDSLTRTFGQAEAS